MSMLGWPLSQLVARLLMLLGPLVGLVAAAAADVPPPGWVTALVVVLAVGWAFMPESVLGTMCLAMVLAWWGVADISGLPAGGAGRGPRTTGRAHRRRRHRLRPARDDRRHPDRCGCG